MRNTSPPNTNTNTNNTVNIENIEILTGTQAEVKPKLEAYLGSHTHAKIIGYAICSQPKKTQDPETQDTKPEDAQEPAPAKGKKAPAPKAATLVEVEQEIIHSYTLAYVF